MITQLKTIEASGVTPNGVEWDVSIRFRADSNPNIITVMQAIVHLEDVAIGAQIEADDPDDEGGDDEGN